MVVILITTFHIGPYSKAVCSNKNLKKGIALLNPLDQSPQAAKMGLQISFILGVFMGVAASGVLEVVSRPSVQGGEVQPPISNVCQERKTKK